MQDWRVILRSLVAALALCCGWQAATAQTHPPKQLTYDLEEAGHASWSPDGSMIAYNSGEYGSRDIWTIPVNGGTPVQITTHPANDDAPDWSPDQSRLVFSSNRAGNDDVWIYQMADGLLTQLTSHPGSDWYPKWSPDGSEIVFCSDRGGSLDIWKISAAGGTAQRITSDPGTEWAPAWSPDGSRIVYVGFSSGNNDLWTTASDGTGVPTQVTTYGGHDLLASWSPDGAELAFTSDRSGSMDIWRIPTAGGEALQVTSGPDDDINPDWSYDGDYIAFGSTREGCCDIWIAPLNPFTRVTEGPQATTDITSTTNWVDVNNDNLPDLFITCPPTQNRLYQNNGDGTFSERTGDVIVSEPGSSECFWGDFDNDGDNDAVMANGRHEPNTRSTSYYYLNDGDGNFTKITDDVIATDSGGFEIIGADIDNDRALDLFVGNWKMGGSSTNYLYHGDGNGHFTRIASGDVVADNAPTSESCFADYDNDGDPDLLQSKVGLPDLLFDNQNGELVNTPGQEFLSEPYAMNYIWGDFDNDGDQDLFISNWEPDNSALYENLGSGVFSKLADQDIVNDADYSTGACAGDYDNDGDLDIYVVYDHFTELKPDYLYVNDGSGHFEGMIDNQVVDDPGMYSGRVNAADYDRDGDLDLYLSTWAENEPNQLFRNNGNANHWMLIKPVGLVSNRSAIGSKIRVRAVINDTPVWQLREFTSYQGGGAQNICELHFGLGDALIIDSIKIEWPSGLVDVLTNVDVNQFLVVYEGVSLDLDGDGLIGAADNCPAVYNPGQEDANGDGVGDACCCAERVGDVNGEGEYPDEVTLGDIMLLVDVKFISSDCSKLPCMSEADVNQDGGSNPNCEDHVTLGDIMYLVDYLFITGPENGTLHECL